MARQRLVAGERWQYHAWGSEISFRRASATRRPDRYWRLPPEEMKQAGFDRVAR